MGLGPPVCDKCKVIGQLMGDTWTCPVCYNVRMAGNLFEYTDEYQQYLKDNTKFMKFIKGENVNDC